MGGGGGEGEILNAITHFARGGVKFELIMKKLTIRKCAWSVPGLAEETPRFPFATGTVKVGEKR